MPQSNLEVLKGTLDLVVLTTLASTDEMHGFDIIEWVSQRTNMALDIEQGALYPALHRLEAKGWLASTWGISEKGRKAKYYRITARGRRALQQEETRWRRYVDAVANLSTAPD